VCCMRAQVPEAFLEEFPAAMYAAEIRHRKSVSLGRHVVCRANLQPLSEHQLAGLATMARQQLVALCMLQTAELHMVPYFGELPGSMQALVGTACVVLAEYSLAVSYLCPWPLSFLYPRRQQCNAYESVHAALYASDQAGLGPRCAGGFGPND
jgi:hypothetical protein